MKDKSQNKKQSKPRLQKASDTNLSADDKEIIRKAMLASLQEKVDQQQKDIKQDMSAMTSTVEEFLKSFIILGYTFKGEPVQCISAHTQQEADSLVTLVNKFFHNQIDDESGPDQI